MAAMEGVIRRSWFEPRLRRPAASRSSKRPPPGSRQHLVGLFGSRMRQLPNSHALLQKLKRTPTNRGCRMSSSPIRLWLMRHHDAERERRSRLSFMQWPTAWLWIAVIVAVALLVAVGLAVK